MTKEIAEMWADILGGTAVIGRSVVGPTCWSVKLVNGTKEDRAELILSYPSECFTEALAQAVDSGHIQPQRDPSGAAWPWA